MEIIPSASGTDCTVELLATSDGKTKLMTSWFFEGSGDKNNSGEGRDMEAERGKEREDAR
jgi:hypothetical protein